MSRTVLLLAVSITLASQFVAAVNCKDGTDYCGYGLLGIGNYQDQINEAIKKAALDPSNQSVTSNTLFHCIGGDNGDISVVRFCNNGCIDGGPGKNDSCHILSSSSSSSYATAAVTPTLLTTHSSTATLSTAIPSATTITPESSVHSNNSSSTPVGAIVGGVIGGVAGLAILFFGVFLLFKRSRQRQSLNEDGHEQSSMQEESAKHMEGSAPTAKDQPVVHEAPHHPAETGHEIHEAPGNPTETRYELG